MSPGKLYFCFGVGFGNFSTGREWRMADLVKMIGDKDPERLDVIAWYGSTGNVAVKGERPTDVLSLLRDVSGRDWAVVDRSRVLRGLEALNGWDPRDRRPRTRWTGGLAFAVSGDRGGAVEDTERAKLRRLESGMVAVYKNDAVTVAGHLDRSQRRGGWGAISLDVSRQVEGVWTARSRRTIEGLLDRVERS
ncbi:MAG TPA: hypothetical protein VFI59_06720 [Actinomycetota bacterium]|nr:hypothetical protein [Actinomycetota bacterium]